MVMFSELRTCEFAKFVVYYFIRTVSSNAHSNKLKVMKTPKFIKLGF